MKIILLLLLLFSINLSFANDFYWIGDSGNWDNTENWSLESGGESVNKTPSTNDNVIFDDNSFSSPNPQVIFNTVSVNSFYFLSHKTTAFNGGSITIKNRLDIQNNAIFNSIIEFNSNDENSRN